MWKQESSLKLFEPYSRAHDKTSCFLTGSPLSSDPDPSEDKVAKTVISGKEDFKRFRIFLILFNSAQLTTLSQQSYDPL